VPTIRARARRVDRSIDRSIDPRDRVEPRAVDRIERVDRRRARFDSIDRDRRRSEIFDARLGVHRAIVEPRHVSRTRARFV